MSDLRSKQVVVWIGAATGIAVAGGLNAALYYHVLPILPGCETPLGRVLLALRCGTAAVWVLLLGIGAVALLRLTTDAIDPTAGAEDKRMFLHGRYVANTLEQFVLFYVALLGLSTFLDAQSARLLPCLTGVFMLARIAFWIGYLRHPLLRAPGMAATQIQTLLILGYVSYRMLRAVLGAPG